MKVTIPKNCISFNREMLQFICNCTKVLNIVIFLTISDIQYNLLQKWFKNFKFCNKIVLRKLFLGENTVEAVNREIEEEMATDKQFFNIGSEVKFIIK